MNITEYQVHPFRDLYRVIQQTHLMGNPDIHPFATADIQLEHVSYADLVPTQNFVLKSQLKRIRDLHFLFASYGIDLAKILGFVAFKTAEGGGTPYVFTPPLVEVIDGQPLIIDGMHRATYCGHMGKTFNALFIRQVDSSVWPYQLPTRDGWTSIQIFDDVLPDGFVRKQKRYPTSEQNKYFFREYPFPGLIKLMREHTGR